MKSSELLDLVWAKAIQYDKDHPAEAYIGHVTDDVDGMRSAQARLEEALGREPDIVANYINRGIRGALLGIRMKFEPGNYQLRTKDGDQTTDLHQVDDRVWTNFLNSSEHFDEGLAVYFYFKAWEYLNSRSEDSDSN